MTAKHCPMAFCAPCTIVTRFHHVSQACYRWLGETWFIVRPSKRVGMRRGEPQGREHDRKEGPLDGTTRGHTGYGEEGGMRDEAHPEAGGTCGSCPCGNLRARVGGLSRVVRIWQAQSEVIS